MRHHAHVLTPGRFVGAESADDSEETYGEGMERVTAMLAEQIGIGADLDAVIRDKLGAMGYAV